MANYWVTSGDTQFFKTELFPVYNSIATFYSELLVKNKTFYTLKNMTDPDEYANGGKYRYDSAHVRHDLMLHS